MTFKFFHVKKRTKGEFYQSRSERNAYKKTISTVNIDKETEVIHTIQTLDSFRAKKTLSTNELVPALELLFNRWLPMPLLEIENNGQTCAAPTGWCRLKMRKISN